jgi:arylformamidase
MKIIDITKPFFKTNTYPGDPVPEYKSWFSIREGAVCNLHTLSFGTHTSTHIDAPYHFYEDGNKVDSIPLEKCVGECRIITADEEITAEWLETLEVKTGDRVLFKGDVTLTVDAARYLAERKINLIGTELNTVGDTCTGPEIHRILLGEQIVILENIDLKNAEDGEYLLMAQPLKLEGMDGSPVRAVLLKK